VEEMPEGEREEKSMKNLIDSEHVENVVTSDAIISAWTKQPGMFGGPLEPY
jgi:hypothetical protein